MYISSKDWLSFVNKLSKINQAAADAIKDYVAHEGFADTDALISYCYYVADYYGTASATWAAMMYDTVGELEGMFYPAAELAPNPTYGEVAKAVQGTLKTSQNIDELSGAVSRLVKRTGQDTILQNAQRDGAQFAWIPSGETCAFCITLASRGWQYMSKKALKNGHAEHIHSNCDCTYMIRHSEDFDVDGYDPQKYADMYYDAEGKTPKQKINSMRRKFYAENREEILDQKADAYEKRKELNSSEAEETKIN